MSETERDILYRIARRNGFSENDLEGKNAAFISHLLALRDKGHFPNSLRGSSIEELQMMLNPGKSPKQQNLELWAKAHTLDSRV